MHPALFALLAIASLAAARFLHAAAVTLAAIESLGAG